MLISRLQVVGISSMRCFCFLIGVSAFQSQSLEIVTTDIPVFKAFTSLENHVLSRSICLNFPESGYKSMAHVLLFEIPFLEK